MEWYVEIRYLITWFQSYKLLNLSLLVYGIVTQKTGKHWPTLSVQTILREMKCTMAELKLQLKCYSVMVQISVQAGTPKPLSKTKYGKLRKQHNYNFYLFFISPWPGLIHPCQKRALIPLKFEVIFNYNNDFQVAQSYPHGPKLAQLTVLSSDTLDISACVSSGLLRIVLYCIDVQQHPHWSVVRVYRIIEVNGRKPSTFKTHEISLGPSKSCTIRLLLMPPMQFSISDSLKGHMRSYDEVMMSICTGCCR